MKTLIIGDNPFTRQVVESQIQSLGYEVTSCADTEKALELYQQTFYPLIVLDLNQSVKSSEFCRRLRALLQENHSMILVISTQANLEELQAIIAAGADDYLIKPVSMDQLQIKVALLARQFQTLARYTQAEAKIKHLNAVLRAIRHINQVIVREKDPHRLIQNVCHTLIETRGFSTAKIVLLEESGKLLQAVEAGLGKKFQSLINMLETGKLPYCFRQGLAQKELLVIENPSVVCANCPLSTVYQDDRKMIVRLEHVKKFYGLLTVSLPTTLNTAEEEQMLLQEVAGDIAFALHSIELEEVHTRAEQALREERDKARQYLDIAGVIIVILDRDQHVTLINKKGCRVLGYSEAEILGKNWVEHFIPERERERVIREGIAKVMAGELTPDEYFENPIVTKNGVERIIAWSNTVLKDVEGRSIGTISSGEDITERKLTEEALRVSEQQYHFLADHIADGVLILQEGKITFVNQAMQAINGYTRDQMIEQDFIHVIRHDYRAEYRKRLDLIVQGVGEPTWETPSLTQDGREIWTEGYHSAIQWQGKPAILITTRDITERKLRELAIEQEKNRLQSLNLALTATMRERYRFGDLIGKSSAMQEMYELIINAAASDASVIIYGESGTGKELVAQTIHKLSERHDQAFVPVNCGAIPETLFESEFFGYRKGAFTGAYKDKRGLLDHAHGGTLFLDEVGELTPAIQVKLLRALSGGEYTPLGDYTVRKTDVRLIVATNRNLGGMVKQGKIREDFYYRITVLPITLPPLRDRREDILILVDHFLKQFNKGALASVLPGDVLKALYEYDWPGNVRELQNVLQRYIATKRLDFNVSWGIEPTAASDTQEGQGFHATVKEFAKQVLLRALEQNQWHRTKTAAMLGISRRSLFRQMQKYGLI
jgi:PAS domain S-box-containing protein